MSKRRPRHRMRVNKGIGPARGVLDVPAGCERSQLGTQTVIRRRDNLDELRRTRLTDARLASLRLYRDAWEAVGRDMGYRCALDQTPRGGDITGALSARIRAAAWFDRLHDAVPQHCQRTVAMIVVDGWTLTACVEDIGGRATVTRARLVRHLEAAADAVTIVLDQVYGRARMNVA